MLVAFLAFLSAQTSVVTISRLQPGLEFEQLYHYPEANRQLFLDDEYVSCFRFILRSEPGQVPGWETVSQTWRETGLPPLSEFPVQIKMEGPVTYRGHRTVFLDVFPWRLNDISGKWEILEHCEIRLTGAEIRSDYSEDALNRQDGTESYLILTTSEFLSTAQAFENLHENLLPSDRRLDVEIELADQFDISNRAALMREFLLDRMNVNPDLRYLLLLGSEETLPPIYHNSTPSDDYYTTPIENAALPQLATGRIPFPDPDDAASYYEKVEQYLLNPVPGSWKNKLLLLADDTNKNGGSFFSERKHVVYSDSIFTRLNTHLSVTPLYGTEYTPVPGIGWLVLPDMTEDVLTQLNSGVAMMNYIGHGSPTTLADEKILDMDRDLQQISDPVGAIWVVGTCKFGWYDYKEAMSEAVLAKDDGAVALIATTRDIPASGNFSFLDKLFSGIRDYVTDENDYRLADYLLELKIGSFYEELFHVLGDPALILPFPKTGDLVDESVLPPEIRLLESNTVMLNPNYSSDLAHLTVRGPNVPVVFSPYNDEDFEAEYHLPGELVYQGDFQGNCQFIVPLDFSQDEIRLRLYSENTGLENDLINRIQLITGIPVSPDFEDISDSSGPDITLMQNNSVIADGGVIFPPWELTAVFEDPSGINLMGVPGHELRYWLDDDPPVNLIADFIFENTSLGQAAVHFGEQEAGFHILNVEAWDNVNNRSLVQYQLEFSSETGFRVQNLLNYPNPFSRETWFTFQLSHSCRAEISIFTAEGIPVKTLKLPNAAAGYNSVYWDGLDAHGRQIANGTYLYRLKADSPHAGSLTETSKLIKIIDD